MSTAVNMHDKRWGNKYGTVRSAGKVTPLVCWFEECRKDSVPLVGGKCSSLGELISAGVRVPPGFALTTEGYRRFMTDAGIDREIQSMVSGLDAGDMEALENTSGAIREMIEAHPFSAEIEDLVAERYRKLAVRSCLPAVPVAVRSSATAEDLPGASFAGQQDTYLWVRGADEVLHNMRRCISSLYTGRAIATGSTRGMPTSRWRSAWGCRRWPTRSPPG